MIDKGAVEQIGKYAQAAITPTVGTLQGLPPTNYVAFENGKADIREIPVAPLAQKFTCLKSMAASLKASQFRPHVYIGSRFITGFWREEFTHSRCLFPLVLTDESLLLNIKRQLHEFRRDCKITLRNALGANSQIPSLLERVKVENNQTTVAEKAAHRSSMSRALTENVTSGDTPLPEFVTLNIRIWQNVPIRTAIQCALEVDGSGVPQFTLTPMPDEMETAHRVTREWIAEHFDGIAVEIAEF